MQWSDVSSAMAAISGVVAFSLLVAAFLYPRSRKVMAKYGLAFGLFAVGCSAAVWTGNNAQATQMGWPSYSAMVTANQYGVYSPQVWQSTGPQLISAREQHERDVAANTAALSSLLATLKDDHLDYDEAQCGTDLKCMANANLPDAIAPCRDKIEALAGDSYQWTTDAEATMFLTSAWAAGDKGPIDYKGDSLKISNGYGGTQRVNYLCQYDPRQDVVTYAVLTPSKQYD